MHVVSNNTHRLRPITNTKSKRHEEMHTLREVW